MRGTKPNIRQEAEPLEPAQAPEWLSEDARAEWSRVMPILTQRKILTEADLGSLENYCIAQGQVREMERHLQEFGHVLMIEGALKRNPAVGIQSDAMTRARLLAAELGATPVARSRPAVRDGEDDDSELD
jgi:P27 family predicted phage terminase small subunit